MMGCADADQTSSDDAREHGQENDGEQLLPEGFPSPNNVGHG
jgi:hypothetical protein